MILVGNKSLRVIIGSWAVMETLGLELAPDKYISMNN